MSEPKKMRIRRGKPVVYRGKLYRSVSAAARAAGVRQQTMSEAVLCGMRVKGYRPMEAPK